MLTILLRIMVMVIDETDRPIVMAMIIVTVVVRNSVDNKALMIMAVIIK